MEDIVFWVMVVSKFVINVVVLNDVIVMFFRNWMLVNFYIVIFNDLVIVDVSIFIGN